MGNGRAMLPHNIYSFLVQWSANLRSKGRLMILYFFIWYSLVSPAAGREGGRKSRGTPPNPRPWDCRPPAPPAVVPQKGERMRRRTRVPRPWDSVPRHPLLRPPQTLPTSGKTLLDCTHGDRGRVSANLFKENELVLLAQPLGGQMIVALRRATRILLVDDAFLPAQI